MSTIKKQLSHISAAKSIKHIFKYGGQYNVHVWQNRIYQRQQAKISFTAVKIWK